MEGKRISQNGRCSGIVRREGILNRRARLDASHFGTERYLGRLYWRRREDGDSVESVCKTFHAAGPASGSCKDCEISRAPDSKTFAADRTLQISGIEYRQALGSAVHASDFPEGYPRIGKRLRQKGSVYQGRWVYSFRHSDARHVQGSVCPDGIRI